MNNFLFIYQIWQRDNYTFSIEWSDKLIQHFRLCHLQRHCPCIRCTDEITGKIVIDPTTISENVRAVSVRSMGRYGLKIFFTSGCSAGIYSFDQLRTYLYLRE